MTTHAIELIDMLKTLADENRLLILRLLHEREYTVGELAGRIDLGEPTVSHHLSKMRETGFVTLRMAGNQRFYRANEAGLNAFKRIVAEIEHMPQPRQQPISDEDWIAALGWSDEDAQVLRDFTLNGVMTIFPAKRKKQLVLLRWLATLFEADKLYSELEVNAVLKRVYAEDFVMLRRDLVDMGYLRRERGGGKYWVSNE
jgi:DNA-binding HxlR family transcriptional regulator